MLLYSLSAFRPGTGYGRDPHTPEVCAAAHEAARLLFEAAPGDVHVAAAFKDGVQAGLEGLEAA